MTDGAREAAWTAYRFADDPDQKTFDAWVDVAGETDFNAGFDAGVVEGIRRAREAVNAVQMLEFGFSAAKPFDPYSACARILAELDTLGANRD
jgi:hypothetical protein